ncbi:MAG TPA: peptide ABC transporter substrate-binding protein, partial [Pirellulales bacterium]
GLVNWDPKTLESIPGIAKSWDISDDRLTYTFHLRDDARWNDNTPVTAHDFAWQWRRILDPATVGKYSYQLWYIKNAERYSSKQFDIGDNVEVELHRRPENSLPYARGEMVRGKLVAKIAHSDPKKASDKADGGDKSVGIASTEKVSSAPIFVVQVNGQLRSFQPVRGREMADWHNPDLNDDALAQWSATEFAASNPDMKLPKVEPCRDVLLDFNEVGVKAVDDRTLRVELRAPTPFFLFLTGYYPLFPTNPRCVETYGYPAWTKPEHLVNNGPFNLQSRRVRERIRLVKNDRYWNAANVKLNTVDVLAVESLATSLNLYLTGRVDWIDKPPVTAVPELLKAKWLGFDPHPGMIVYFYRLNCTKPPLDNPLVRKALALAVNKKEIVETVTHGGEIPALSITPPDMGGYVPPTMGTYDPDQARKLLADAGFPGGHGFPKMDILYNTEEAHQLIAELIQAQWKENLGINVGLQNMEWNAYQAAQENLQYQVSRAAWGGDYVDPNT